MTRRVQIHAEPQVLRPSEQQWNNLSSFLTIEVEDAYSARTQQEALWRHNQRDYEALPARLVRNTPIENAPNLVVPISQMSVDIFNSVFLQTLFDREPFVSVKGVPGKGTPETAVKSMQNFADWGTRNEFRPDLAAENVSLDNIQHGTGVYYIPWIENVRKTKVETITSAHPKMLGWPIEDTLAPGGAYDEVDELPWISLRGFYSASYLNEMAKRFGWLVGNVTPVGTVGWVRRQRELMGRTHSNTKLNQLYEIHDIYVYYDIDGDGIEEDLLVTWDRTSRTILKLRYNPYDRRPIEIMRYMRRGYLFYGMGMVEKLRNLQAEISEIHNARNLNMMIANTRLWKARSGSGLKEGMKIWPNKVITMTDPEDLQSEQLGEIYPSSPQAESISTEMARQLVGLNEMGQQRQGNLLSSRTPATTAAIGAQQQASRFAASFKSGRRATSDAVKQCLWRYQERVRMGDLSVFEHITKTVGSDQASEVLNLMRNQSFDESVIVEVTATGDRTSRQAEQQSLVQLGQVLLQYYGRIMDLGTLAMNPQVPQPIRDLAGKVADASGELVERTVRSFDTIRDPEKFRIDIQEQLHELGALASASTFSDLATTVQGAEEIDQLIQQGSLPQQTEQ